MYNNNDYRKMMNGLGDLINNPNPRVPVMLCLDISISMMGKPIAELNAGVRQFLNEMKSDSITCKSAEIAIVTFSSDVDFVSDFTTADNIASPVFTANGITCMGEGLEMAMNMLEKRKNKYKKTGIEYYQPILVVMSDGAPNGDPKLLNDMISKIQQQIQSRRLTVISVGIGNDADMVVMNRLSKNDAVNMNNICFREFFVWLSQSVSHVSASAVSDEEEPDFEALKLVANESWKQDTL